MKRFLYVLLLAVTAYACNKKHSDPVSPETTAQTLFASLASLEKAPSLAAGTQHVHGVPQRIQPLSKMSEHILWDKATHQQQNALSYAIVPLDESIKPFKNKDYEFFRNLVFYKDGSNKENMVIVEVLGNKGTSLGTDLQTIAKTAFENNYFSRSNAIDGIDALVFFFNAQYEPNGSFQFEDGKWKPIRASFRSDLDITR